MIVASLNDAGRVHGGRAIFTGLTWAIEDGEKAGLVGASGAGKSTLLRTLAGVDRPESGSVIYRRGAKVSFLAQEYSGTPGRHPIDELIDVRDDIRDLNARILSVEGELADPVLQQDADRFDRALAQHARLLEEFERSGAVMLRNRAESLLNDLGLPRGSWNQPIETLSGGQRKIVGLARCLLAEPDLLLLDEPDNHLDLPHKRMLENAIRSFPGAVVVVSHDRYFLDETVGQIAELEPARGGARLVRWEGNYSAYATQKELALLRQQKDFVAQQKEIAGLEAAISRFKLWASIVVNERHIKQARNKQRQIDRMEKVERPVLERRRMSLQFRPRQRGGAKAVELRSVAKAFGDHLVLLDVAATVMNGERVGIVGANGSGKSVLLRLVMGLMEPDEGTVWIGPSIERGYYSQEHETLDMTQTPIEALRAVRQMYESDAVSQLGRFLLPYDILRQPIANLSGGEKSRVQLARLMAVNPNCLVLDEPTNNLDIASCEVLEAALDRFSGAIIVVSHDRYFLDRIVDRIFEVRDGELRVFDGSYSDYAEAVDRTERAS